MAELKLHAADCSVGSRQKGCAPDPNTSTDSCACPEGPSPSPKPSPGPVPWSCPVAPYPCPLDRPPAPFPALAPANSNPFPTMRMFLGMISSRNAAGSTRCRLQRLRSATATALLAAAWPTMWRSRAATIAEGVRDSRRASSHSRSARAAMDRGSRGDPSEGGLAAAAVCSPRVMWVRGVWARGAGSWVWVAMWVRVGKGVGLGWRMVGQREELEVGKEGREGRECGRVWQALHLQVDEQGEMAWLWVLGLLGSVWGGWQAAVSTHGGVPLSWLLLPFVRVSAAELGCEREAC